MGKIEAESNIDHFSHHHPLKLILFQSSSANKTTCSACRKQASGLKYICEPCNYCLHKPCANMPQTLTHKADEKHNLVLHSTPAYTDGSFQCNACGVVGTGFCYHCQECQLDLHAVCAFMCSSVKGPAHEHPLELYFKPPYEETTFVCNVCGGPGLNHWVYRCDPCEFDAHLKCAKRPLVVQQLGTKVQKNQQANQVCKSTSVHNSTHIVHQHPLDTESSRQLHGYHTAPVYLTQGFVHTAVPAYPTQGFVQGPMRNNTVENIVQSVIEGLIEGGASQIGQALMCALGN